MKQHISNNTCILANAKANNSHHLSEIVGVE